MNHRHKVATRRTCDHLHDQLKQLERERNELQIMHVEHMRQIKQQDETIGDLLQSNRRAFDNRTNLLQELRLAQTARDMYKHSGEALEQESKWAKWVLTFAIVFSFSIGFYTGGLNHG